MHYKGGSFAGMLNRLIPYCYVLCSTARTFRNTLLLLEKPVNVTTIFRSILTPVPVNKCRFMLVKNQDVNEVYWLLFVFCGIFTKSSKCATITLSDFANFGGIDIKKKTCKSCDLQVLRLF